MNDFLTKISSYNFFNNLFPGVLFCFIGSKITEYELIPDNIFIALFFFYFIGMIISRIGLLAVEKTLRKLKIINFASYDSYIKASKKDNLLITMSETNNTFRTIISLIISLIFLKIYTIIEQEFCFYPLVKYIIIAILLLLIFIFSYKKQTSLIKDRVNSQID